VAQLVKVEAVVVVRVIAATPVMVVMVAMPVG
jgi:hypothetical protein